MHQPRHMNLTCHRNTHYTSIFDNHYTGIKKLNNFTYLHYGVDTGTSFLIDQIHQKNISSSRPLNFPPKLSLSSITALNSFWSATTQVCFHFNAELLPDHNPHPRIVPLSKLSQSRCR